MLIIILKLDMDFRFIQFFIPLSALVFTSLFLSLFPPVLPPLLFHHAVVTALFHPLLPPIFLARSSPSHLPHTFLLFPLPPPLSPSLPLLLLHLSLLSSFLYSSSSFSSSFIPPSLPSAVNEVGSDFPLAIMGRPDGASTGSDDERLAAAAAAASANSGAGPAANGVAIPEVPETIDDAVAENALRSELPGGVAPVANPFPSPRRLQVDRQLSQSVLISWAPPEHPPPDLQAFHIYVDGQFRSAVKVTEKTRALVESLDASRVSWEEVVNEIHIK